MMTNLLSSGSSPVASHAKEGLQVYIIIHYTWYFYQYSYHSHHYFHLCRPWPTPGPTLLGILPTTLSTEPRHQLKSKEIAQISCDIFNLTHSHIYVYFYNFFLPQCIRQTENCSDKENRESGRFLRRKKTLSKMMMLQNLTTTEDETTEEEKNAENYKPMTHKRTKTTKWQT